MSTVADDKLAHVAPDRRSAEHYRVAFAAEGDKGIAVLHGLSGREAAPILERAVRVLEAAASRLADKQILRFKEVDYCSPYASLDALQALLRTAQLFPDAVWTVEEPSP